MYRQFFQVFICYDRMQARWASLKICWINLLLVRESINLHSAAWGKVYTFYAFKLCGIANIRVWKSYLNVTFIKLYLNTFARRTCRTTTRSTYYKCIGDHNQERIYFNECLYILYLLRKISSTWKKIGNNCKLWMKWHISVHNLGSGYRAATNLSPFILTCFKLIIV